MKRALLAAALLLGTPALAAEAPRPLAGMPAAPGTVVAGALVATPRADGAVVLDLGMTRPGSAAPIRDYRIELEKRLHLIAIGPDNRTFLHEHGEAPGPDGHFRVPMRFPFGGTWQVYADAVPAGTGQQVLRFELPVAGGAAPAGPAPEPGGLQATDGAYGVRFAALSPRPGEEAALRLTLLRNGAPAPDVRPYLGVAAHAVLIDAADGSYVHVHAMPAGSMGGGHAGMSHGGAMPAGAKVSPELVMHVTLPRPGTYRLWVQFRAGGAVRTVPFVLKG